VALVDTGHANGFDRRGVTPNSVDGLYLACGMNGHGFKTGPAVGIAVAEHILDGRATTVDIRKTKHYVRAR
jgi:glycine/D-amino acid oxidase-like deaminating enzyme